MNGNGIHTHPFLDVIHVNVICRPNWSKPELPTVILPALNARRQLCTCMCVDRANLLFLTNVVE